MTLNVPVRTHTAVTAKGDSATVTTTEAAGDLYVSTKADDILVSVEARPHASADWFEVLRLDQHSMSVKNENGTRTGLFRVNLQPEVRVRVLYLSGADWTTNTYLTERAPEVYVPGAILSPLSGTDAAGISQVLVTGTDLGSANTVHTGPAGTDTADFVDLWAVNVDGAANRTLTLAVGSALIGPIKVNFDQAPLKVLPNYPLNGSSALLAYASVTNDVLVFGTADRRAVA